MTKKTPSSSKDNAPDAKVRTLAGNLLDARPLVLIVEDEPDVAELIRYNLDRDGFATLIAESGDRAVEAVLQSTPDLVLLDIMLPGMNGWEVCQTIRDRTTGRHVPIIMVSALTTEESRIKGLSLGADDYITKPFSVQELLIKTRNIVSRHAQIRELTAREQEQDSATRYLIHEMKNALNIIGGYSHLAALKSNGSPYLAEIHSSTLHMEALLNDVALLAKLEKGRGEILREEVDAAGIAASLADSLRERAETRHISLTTDGSSPINAIGSAVALRQILTNLISNAIKYNRDHGSVRITCEAVDDKVVLSVIDTGPGIGKDELAQVFDKFYRARSSEGIAGSGIGLYIAKLLTEAMGGSISVTSSLGKGSAFSLFLKRPAASKREGGEKDEGTCDAIRRA
ncbi:MAG: response regulator [Nitrospirae bacterium]|nr:response regulator [Nitrospirota bacterium]